jgi:hypothetical protein
MTTNQLTRRTFLKTGTLAAGGAILAPTIIPSSVLGKNAPSNKINIGQIGFGRIAMSHDLPDTLRYDVARVIAVADVDSNRAVIGKNILKIITQKNKAVPIMSMLKPMAITAIYY